jgi:hypothetical protein
MKRTSSRRRAFSLFTLGRGRGNKKRVHRHLISMFGIAAMLLMVLNIAVLLLPAKNVSATASENVAGWAWSDTGGWLSLNDTNPGSGGGSYGINMNLSTKAVNGFAWSDNQGWVCFGTSCNNNACLSGLTFPYNTPSGSTSTASVNAGNELQGWARMCNISGDDGWVSLNCDTAPGCGSDYGPLVNFGTGQLSGYAWHGAVGAGLGWGWIDFSGVYLTSGFEGTTPTCHDALDNDADGGTDCGNAAPPDDFCAQQVALNCPATEGQCGLLGRSNCCTNGMDDDDDGLIDCADVVDCGADAACIPEICDNGIDDDDADTDIDCDDSECASFPACTPAWIRSNYGSIYANQGVGGNAPPPGQVNATYCITSAGAIANFESAIGCEEASSVPINLASGGNGYISNIGRMDISGALAGRYGTVENVASDAAIDIPLAGKVYAYDRDLNGNTCPSNGPAGANTAFVLSAKAFSNASGMNGRGNGLLVIKGCDLIINGNITYGAGNVSYLKNLASLGVVVLSKYAGGVPTNGGNIYIDSAVTQVVGLYFAERSLHTGSTGGQFSDSKLDVYGALVSRDVKLERRFGSQTEPSEDVIFDGRGVVNPPPGLQDISKSLPSLRDTY